MKIAGRIMAVLQKKEDCFRNILIEIESDLRVTFGQSFINLKQNILKWKCREIYHD
jgi:hypothetical protein